jgi:hypothetical protein
VQRSAVTESTIFFACVESMRAPVPGTYRKMTRTTSAADGRTYTQIKLEDATREMYNF